MGRKQDRMGDWVKYKRERKLIRKTGNIRDTNVLMIDPEEQKKRKAAGKMARKLALELLKKQPTKEELRRKRQKQKRYESGRARTKALRALEQHQLTNDQLGMMVAAKHVMYHDSH